VKRGDKEKTQPKQSLLVVFRKENENPTALKSKIKGKERTKKKKRTEEQTFSGNDLLKYSKKH